MNIQGANCSWVVGEEGSYLAQTVATIEGLVRG
jgi:hypothetical protein